MTSVSAALNAPVSPVPVFVVPVPTGEHAFQTRVAPPPVQTLQASARGAERAADTPGSAAGARQRGQNQRRVHTRGRGPTLRRTTSVSSTGSRPVASSEPRRDHHARHRDRHDHRDRGGRGRHHERRHRARGLHRASSSYKDVRKAGRHGARWSPERPTREHVYRGGRHGYRSHAHEPAAASPSHRGKVAPPSGQVQRFNKLMMMSQARQQHQHSFNFRGDRGGHSTTSTHHGHSSHGQSGAGAGGGGRHPDGDRWVVGHGPVNGPAPWHTQARRATLSCLCTCSTRSH